MKTMSLLVKPASGLCNMRCDYCFYREELSRLQCLRQGIMSGEIMELLIRRACESAEDSLQLTFQGGEPMLAGLDFYRHFVERVNQVRKKQLRVSYSFQTNGIWLDEDWISFFQENQILVGLSFDGTADLHDRYRPDANGEGTAGRVLSAWKLLRENGIPTNLLCVVTRQAARKPERIYHYMRKIGGEYLQFIPCMDLREGGPNQRGTDVREGGSNQWNTDKREGGSHRREKVSQSLAPSPEEYAYFLKGLFDLWYQEWENGCYISVRQFDDYLCLLCGQRPSSCNACGTCGSYLVVENDGSVYPCDFYVEDRLCLGNLKDSSLEELWNGEKMREFLSDPYKGSRCRSCRYYALCRGGCRHDFVSSDRFGQGERENQYCEAYQEFFAYALPRMQKVAREMMRL